MLSLKKSLVCSLFLACFSIGLRADGGIMAIANDAIRNSWRMSLARLEKIRGFGTAELNQDDLNSVMDYTVYLKENAIEKVREKASCKCYENFCGEVGDYAYAVKKNISVLCQMVSNILNDHRIYVDLVHRVISFRSDQELYAYRTLLRSSLHKENGGFRIEKAEQMIGKFNNYIDKYTVISEFSRKAWKKRFSDTITNVCNEYDGGKVVRRRERFAVNEMFDAMASFFSELIKKSDFGNGQGDQ